MELIDQRHVFLEISVALTGFNRAELEATGMADYYFRYVNELFQLSPDVPAAFYKEAAATLRLEGAARDVAIRKNLLPGSCYNGLAIVLINLWYLGTCGGTPVSPQAYVQGLIWGTAGTHPPGARQPGFGSWAIDPASLSSLQTPANEPATI